MFLEHLSSVCLSVCLSKSYKQIAMKFIWRMRSGVIKSSSD